MKRHDLADNVERHLSTISHDGMDIFLLQDGNYRGGILNGTRLVNQMRANHGLGIMETLILGHGYLAAGILTSLVKGNDRIRLDIRCDGPAAGLTVDANARGEIRGHLSNPDFGIDSSPDSLDTAPYLGNGTLTVSRRLEGAKAPVTGHVSLKHGQIARDLAVYFLESEQKPSAIVVSIHFDPTGMVNGAGALFLQALPEKSQSAARDLDAAVEVFPSIGSRLAAGDTPAHLVNSHLGEFGLDMIGSRPVEMQCPCTHTRFERYLRSLPKGEIEAILNEGPIPAKVTCHYCNSSYMYEKEALESFLSA